MQHRLVLAATLLAAWAGFLAYTLVHLANASDPAGLITAAAADPGGTLAQAYLTLLDVVLFTVFGIALVRGVTGRGSALAIAAAVLFTVGNLGHTTEAVLNFVWWAMAQPGTDRTAVLPMIESMATYVLPLIFLSPVSIIVGVSCALGGLARARQLAPALAFAYPIVAVATQFAPLPLEWIITAPIVTLPIVAAAGALAWPRAERSSAAMAVAAA